MKRDNKSLNKRNKIQVDEANDPTNNSSNLVLWNTFFWKMVRSLAIIAAATTAIFFICKWLIY